MVRRSRTRSETIDTGRVQVAPGETREIYDRKLPRSERRHIVRVRAHAPERTSITLSDGNIEINAESKDIESFPQKYIHPYDLGEGGWLKITASHTLSTPVIVRVFVDVIREIREA